MDDIFAAVAAQRRALADVLDELEEAAWSTPSLCAGWSVHDVVGHLIMPFEVSVPQLAWRMARAGGDYDKVADAFARAQRATPHAQLVATLRANAASRFTPPGNGPEAPLTDIVVHGLDVGIPTGVAAEVSPEVTTTILDFLVTPRARRGFVAKGRLDGLRFASADVAWSFGEGELVEGPSTSLLLVLTGRPYGLAALRGEGVAVIAARIGSVAG